MIHLFTIDLSTVLLHKKVLARVELSETGFH